MLCSNGPWLRVQRGDVRVSGRDDPARILFYGEKPCSHPRNVVKEFFDSQNDSQFP